MAGWWALVFFVGEAAAFGGLNYADVVAQRTADRNHERAQVGIQSRRF